ncbi:protein translocase subunit SecF [bacterium (Candidatus Gribaldobacteria) CG_4_10_14_0_8_um_filter_33_9]|uniref:Protein-export membrane protein SecF n=1 Tax=bacterium (Candidatus Gribaldobacteria) CG_4_10_14_0_8_um_filter_33_9 TaxID=2014266 RepID=A0A2M7RNU2_9BACT|nr:MAG: protein translocase subunit SecF [bacterium (Candidatus Gribaldobacteria) CG_4_10_14_0_8_um_filter_33_9]
MQFTFTKYRKIFYGFSVILFVGSIASIFMFGLNWGIDFTGGSSLEVAYKEQNEVPSIESIRQALTDFNLGEIFIQKKGNRGIILKMKNISETEHQEILKKLEELARIEEGTESFQMIGPIIGRELKEKTKTAIILALVAITFYITLAFRVVSRPVKSWQYGLASLVALFHDVVIPIGVFAVLGHFYNVEIDLPFIAAILTVLGFSVHDTIVVYDRIRENLLRTNEKVFDLIINKSLNQTIARSITTVLTTLIVLFALFFFGDPTLKYFSLALIIGISMGAYSSIFIASSLLVTFYRSQIKK